MQFIIAQKKQNKQINKKTKQSTSFYFVKLKLNIMVVDMRLTQRQYV